MKMTEYIRMALYEIWHNKLRTLLTLIGIIIGIGAVMVIVFVVQGAEDFLMAEIEKISPTDLIGVYNSYDARSQRFMGNLSLEDVREIEDILGDWALGVAPRYQTSSSLRYKNKKDDCFVIATTTDFKDIYELEVHSGRFLTPDDLSELRRVVVLGADTAREFFGNEEPLGEKVRLYDTIFTVVGVLAPEEKSILMPVSQNNNRVFIPLTAWERLNGIENNFSLMVRMKERSYISQGSAKIQKYLDSRYGLTEDGQSRFMVRDLVGDFETLKIIKLVLIILLIGVASFTLMVAGIGVMNIMLVIVTERTKQIGLRKALGATRKDILLQFLIESLVLCIFGGLLGIAGGYAGCQIARMIAESFVEVNTAVPFWAVIVSLLFTTLTGIVSGIYPAWKASKMDPVEALRYE